MQSASSAGVAPPPAPFPSTHASPWWQLRMAFGQSALATSLRMREVEEGVQSAETADMSWPMAASSGPQSAKKGKKCVAQR